MSENKLFTLDKEKKDKDHLNIKREYNAGIGLIRIFLSFMVVMDHFYNKTKIQKYLCFLYYHIPSFFLISFYFTYKTLISYNIAKLKLRLERLLIPYFSWCIISWVIRLIYFYVFKIKCNHTLKDFIFNLLNGHIFNVVLWFQNILILTTFTFLIIIFIFKKNYLFILKIIVIIAYILQYSGINYQFFIKNSTVHFRLTFGRFSEAIPNAVTGFFIAKFEIIKKIKKYRKEIIFFSIIIIIMITKYDIFGNLKTFKYGGLRLNVAAICLFLIFSLLPFENINCKIIINIIKKISNYTGGIYFTHYLIGKGFISKKLLLINSSTIIGCFKIYLISYLVCIIGANVFRKSKFKNLFS